MGPVVRALAALVFLAGCATGPPFGSLLAGPRSLPAPYREAAYAVERALALWHFASGSVAVGSFDAVTFGVPLGFYYLVAGTGQGIASLAQGQFDATPESLTDVDFYFWREAFPARRLRENIDAHAVPAIGAYLGEVLVRHLGGRWIPRRKLEESQVLVGDRAWLPFVRAWHYMRTCQSLLDFSLTQFYRVAARHPS